MKRIVWYKYFAIKIGSVFYERVKDFLKKIFLKIFYLEKVHTFVIIVILDSITKLLFHNAYPIFLGEKNEKDDIVHMECSAYGIKSYRCV